MWSSYYIIIKTRPNHMCSNVPARIHPLMNKMRLVIRNWRYRRTMFTIGPIHTRDNNPAYSGAELEHAVRNKGWVLFVCPYKKYIMSRGWQHTPRNTWWPSGWTKISVAQYFIIVNTNTYWCPLIFPDSM